MHIKVRKPVEKLTDHLDVTMDEWMVKLAVIDRWMQNDGDGKMKKHGNWQLLGRKSRAKSQEVSLDLQLTYEAITRVNKRKTRPT